MIISEMMPPYSKKLNKNYTAIVMGAMIICQNAMLSSSIRSRFVLLGRGGPRLPFDRNHIGQWTLPLLAQLTSIMSHNHTHVWGGAHHQ